MKKQPSLNLLTKLTKEDRLDFRKELEHLHDAYTLLMQALVHPTLYPKEDLRKWSMECLENFEKDHETMKARLQEFDKLSDQTIAEVWRMLKLVEEQ